MKSKGIPIAIGVVMVVAVGLLVAHQVRKSSALEQRQAAATVGIVNPDSAKAELTTEPTPQLSQQRFELPPSMGTGSYTEPAAKPGSAKKDSVKKDSNAR